MEPNSFESDANEVCAIVVTYNPDSQLIENLKALVRQVREVIVVDNGSGADGQQILIEASQLGQIAVLYNPENLGIAAALNRGVTVARERGYSWIASFDQDSTVPDAFIKTMLSVWNGCPSNSNVPLVAPRYRDRHTGRISSYAIGDEGPYAEVITTMTSGNLVRTDVFGKVGFFAEDFFMDCVDHEFCLRLRSSGYRIIEVRDAILVHGLGRMTMHRAFGRTFKVFNHRPLRRYYNARNRIIIYRRYGLKFPGWMVKDMTNFFRELAGIVLFEAESRAKMAAVIWGVLDGLLGKTGKCDGRL